MNNGYAKTGFRFRKKFDFSFHCDNFHCFQDITETHLQTIIFTCHSWKSEDYLPQLNKTKQDYLTRQIILFISLARVIRFTYFINTISQHGSLLYM